jgi:uncharacterized protein YndB with AHSA1/START domain
VIDASPETVWGFLVDPEKIVQWKGVNALLEHREGGAYRVEVVPERIAAGEVVVFDPPRRLVHTFGWEGGVSDVEPGTTTVEYELVPEGSATRLLFTHRDLPTRESADSHAEGWDHFIPRLAVVAAGGDPGRDPWLDSERS